MDKPENKEQNITLVDINPSLILSGDKLVNEAIQTLLKLQSKIDTEKMNNPSFLMVLTATGDYAYRREDGIYVVPIGCLKS